MNTDAAAFYAANTDEIVEPLPFDGAADYRAEVRRLHDGYRAEVRRIRAAHLDALEPRVRAAVAGLLWLNDLQRRDVLAVVIDAMRSAER